MKSEPVFTVNNITGIVTAILGLLVAFNVPLTDDQQKALIAVAAIAAPFVASLIARQKVTPVVKG